MRRNTSPVRPRRFSTELKQLGALGRLALDVMLWAEHTQLHGQPSAELHPDRTLPILRRVDRATDRVGGSAPATVDHACVSFSPGRLDLDEAEAVFRCIDAEGRSHANEGLSQTRRETSRVRMQIPPR